MSDAMPVAPTPPPRPPLGANGLFKARAYTRWSGDDDAESADDIPADGVFPEPEPGKVRIGPDVLTPQALDDLAELAKQIKLDESLSAKRLKGMVDSMRETQTVSKEDLKDFERFVKSMRTWHKELHQAFRDSDYQDKKVDSDLLRVHQFLTQWDAAKERYRIDARTKQLERIAEGSPSFSPTTAGFYTFAQISQQDMKDSLGVMDGIHHRDPDVVIEGNRAHMLTRDRIWRTKMALLDDAIRRGKAGQPTEIDVQYYELTSQTMLRKLVQAARAGNKVRVNMDPGRITVDREGYQYASEITRKLQTAYRLLDAANQGHDIALSLFPVEREIGDKALMHQKLFRVGEKVILGGMNANSQSGENVDAAVLLVGPAAKKLVEVFQRDVQLSKAAKLKELYDPEKTAAISAGGMLVGPSALVALLLNAGGAESRGVDAAHYNHDGQTLDALAEQAGTRLDLIVDFEDKNGDKELTGADLEDFLKGGDAPSNVLALKREGGRLMARQLKEVVDLVNGDDNISKLDDISMPEGKPTGTAAVALGDKPIERVALMLEAIGTAENHIYIPSFVMTRVVARAIAARYQELKAQGKELDVRVVLDPGIYGDGGTPNEAGYLALEDAGIPVRWAMLTRTNETHDRKIHAKAIITEKMAVLGSTNMSSRGLMDNWELSGVVMFDDSKPDNMVQRTMLERDFLQTWDHESIRIDTRKVAENRLAQKSVPDKAARIEESRKRVVFETIHHLRRYENESAGVVKSLIEKHPELKTEVDYKLKHGWTEGYAVLNTVEEKLGDEYYRELALTPSRQKLERMHEGEFAAAD